MSNFKATTTSTTTANASNVAPAPLTDTEKLKNISISFNKCIETQNLDELDKKLHDYMKLLHSVDSAEVWYTSFKDHLSLCLLQKSEISQTFCMGKKCAGNWQGMMLKTMSENLLCNEADEKDAEYAQKVFKFCVLTFTTTYFWGLENLPHEKFEGLFKIAYQEMLNLGWNNKHVDMGRNMLKSFLYKVNKGWTSKKNGMTIENWNGIVVMLKKIEEFVFYFPRYHHGKFGVHLPGAPGAVITDVKLPDTELIQSVVKMLNKTLNVRDLYSVLSQDNDQRIDEQRIKKESIIELNYFEEVAKWFMAVNKQEKQGYDQIVNQLVPLMLKRPLYGVEYHGVKTDKGQISFVLLGIPADLKRRMRVKPSQGNQAQNFRDLNYNIVFGQLVAGLHVIKRIADYLQKVVETYEKTVQDMDKVVGRDWLPSEKSISHDNIPEHANTCKMFHSASSSINSRLLTFAKKIKEEVISPMRKFHDEGEKVQRECDQNSRKCARECREIRSKHTTVQTKRQRCLQIWEKVVETNRQLEAACDDSNLNKDIRAKRKAYVKDCYDNFSEYETDRTEYVEVSKDFEGRMTDLFNKMQNLEERRLITLKESMEKYCNHFEAFTQPMTVLSDFKTSVGHLDSETAMQSFTAMAQDPDSDIGKNKRTNSTFRSSSIVGHDLNAATGAPGNGQDFDGENINETYGSMMKVKAPPPPLPCTAEALTSGKYKPPHDAIDVLTKVLVVKPNGSREIGIVQAPLNDGCYPISFENQQGQHMIPQELVDPNVDKKSFVILVIGLAKHGKTTTLHNLFGVDLKQKPDSTKRKVDILWHNKVKDLVFLDVPGISATDPLLKDTRVESAIMDCVKDVGDPDVIIVCRQFTHPQTGDYQVLKKIVNSMSRKFSRAHLLLAYTRSCDAPDIGIIGKNATIKKQVQEYKNPPYNYSVKAAKHAAFRNYRVTQANEERFHRVFFIENDEDEEGSLPDGTKCWVPLINALAKMSPSKMNKESFSPAAASCLKTLTGNTAAGICPACKLRGTNIKTTDCEFCNVPMIRNV